MSFLKWHKKQVEKNLNMFGLSNYQGLWVSFIKGLIFGAIIMWFVSCNEQVVVKRLPLPKLKQQANFNLIIVLVLKEIAACVNPQLKKLSKA